MMMPCRCMHGILFYNLLKKLIIGHMKFKTEKKIKLMKLR